MAKWLEENMRLAQRVARAVQWHQDQLFPFGGPPYIDLLVVGAPTQGEPVKCGMYACLFPDGYTAMDTGGATETVDDIRKVIAGFCPSEATIQQQLDAIRQLCPEIGPDQYWDLAEMTAIQFGVPIAFFAFGGTVPGGKPVVLLRSLLSAPLSTVAQRFKDRAPLPSQN